MTPEDVARLFTGTDGTYRFARWGRPIAPIVFGVDDSTLGIVKGACEAVAALAGHHLAETDPELGANLMVFFFRDWEELPQVPGLDRMIPDLAPLVARLVDDGASHYRAFRFDRDGAIKAAFVFLRMGPDLSALPADTLALTQITQAILLWSDQAFATRSPLAIARGTVILRPEIADVIRAAYDPLMPAAATDASHALRLYARLAGRT